MVFITMDEIKNDELLNKNDIRKLNSFFMNIHIKENKNFGYYDKIIYLQDYRTGKKIQRRCQYRRYSIRMILEELDVNNTCSIKKEIKDWLRELLISLLKSKRNEVLNIIIPDKDGLLICNEEIEMSKQYLKNLSSKK